MNIACGLGGAILTGEHATVAPRGATYMMAFDGEDGRGEGRGWNMYVGGRDTQ